MLQSNRCRLLVLAALTFVALGCGDEADGESGGADSDGNANGTGSAAGASDGAGGETAGSGAGGSAAACEEDPNTCVQDCLKPELLQLGVQCPDEVCTAEARCLEPALLGAITEEQLALLADCPDGLTKCVPAKFIETVNKFDLKNCTSVNGFEGRCVSSCLPSVAEQAAFLPVDVCELGEKCAPCFDPFTGEPTGACGLSCDDPPATPVEQNTFTGCCASKGVGHCLPNSLVSGASGDVELDTAECEALGQADTSCVPDEVYQQITSQGFFEGTACEPDIVIQFSGGSVEGACLPRCIPEVETQSLSIEVQAKEFPFHDLVLQTTCPNGYACLPCYLNGELTGACGPQGT
jgi:hypothetical protein